MFRFRVGPRVSRATALFTEGKYSVWFRTPVGEGAGLVSLKAGGELEGCDTTFAYTGNWELAGERFKATLRARRVSPGPPGVFGMDEVDIVIMGTCRDATSFSCAGFAKQSPGLKLDVTPIRLRDDI